MSPEVALLHELWDKIKGFVPQKERLRVAEEVIRASIVLGEKERDFGILSITSSDLLFSDWKKSHYN